MASYPSFKIKIQVIQTWIILIGKWDQNPSTIKLSRLWRLIARLIEDEIEKEEKNNEISHSIEIIIRFERRSSS